ncbi:hypothetical protein KUCAC02_013197 [Chaenocephalus aceratus]|uniref:Uncharacterized protein n=1 Tax=Chaenocephalus aceratus TaxID=36190 RepID=A0ACB9XF20_CHAAC|nr:hypothetical protein KUCAC02_013197 [Chaenocephalus aceratus]
MAPNEEGSVLLEEPTDSPAHSSENGTTEESAAPPPPPPRPLYSKQPHANTPSTSSIAPRRQPPLNTLPVAPPTTSDAYLPHQK